MRKALLLTTGLAWFALTGSAYAFSISLTPGPMDPLYFASKGAGENNFTLGGITWTDMAGVADTEKGTLPDVYAAPFGMGTSLTKGTTYMAVEGGGKELATFSTPQTSLTIYWGSIDADIAGTPSAGNLNSVTINVGGVTITGADLVAAGASGTGCQTCANSNELVRITGLPAFTTATFASTHNAFEFSMPTVPEPSTWAMMVLGFAGLGYAAFRRSSKSRAAVAI